MTNRSMPDISIYEMQLFITLVEEKSFSAAASLMNITQPTMSKRIKLLESSIGVPLINRNERPIHVTNDGQILYEHWKNICLLFQNSLDDMFKSNQGKGKIVKVGWFNSGNMLSQLPLAAKNLSRTFENLNYQLYFQDFRHWPSKLLNREIDIMITIHFESNFLDDKFEWMPISQCPKLVCMLDSNPLSKQETVDYTDLEDQKFVMISPLDTPVYENYVCSLFKAFGFKPKVARYAPNASSLVNSLYRDNEVLICDQYLRGVESPNIKCFELKNIQSGLIAVWKKGSLTPLIKAYIDELKNFFS